MAQGLFLLHNKVMDAYVYRLIRIGFGKTEAEEVAKDFLFRFGAVALDEYITELEEDYVDTF